MYIVTAGPKCNVWFEPFTVHNPREAIAELLEWWNKPDLISIEGTKLMFHYFDDNICDEEFYIAEIV